MTSPLPIPEGSPNAGPQLVPEQPKRGKFLIAAVALVVVAAAAWIFRPAKPAAVATVVVPTAKAVRGSIEATRRVAGSIMAGGVFNLGGAGLAPPRPGGGVGLAVLAHSRAPGSGGAVGAPSHTRA